MDNLIIDFTQTSEAFRPINLIHKIQSKGRTYTYVRIAMRGNLQDLPDETLKLIREIDSQTRVYIIAHGTPSATTIMGVHYQDLADLFGQNIQDERTHSSLSQLNISFITCYGGRGTNSGLVSYGGLFHRYLGQNYKIYSQVLARDDLTWTLSTHKATGSDIAYAMKKIGLLDEQRVLKHQKPGKKISLQWDERGDEWVVDAYIDKYFSKSRELLVQITKLIVKGSLSETDVEILNKSLKKLIELMSGKGTELSVEELVHMGKVIAEGSMDETKLKKFNNALY